MPRKAKPADNHHSEAVEKPRSPRRRMPPAEGGDAAAPVGGINEKIRQLIRLSKEQGYLTFDDINEALPESIENQEEIDNVLSILQNLEIEILEPDQVEDYKQRQEEAEEEESRSSQNDILDDPVRMYLKQMGQVPLLTREQEVEISKRIENAELKAQEALFQASAVGGYIAVLGAKLLNREERFDRIVIDKKIESRDAYFKTLPKLVETTQKNEAAPPRLDEQSRPHRPERKKALSKFRKRETALRANFPKFYFKLKVYEEYLEQLRPVLEEIETLHFPARARQASEDEEGRRDRHPRSTPGCARSRSSSASRRPSSSRSSADDDPRARGPQGQDRDGGGQPAPGDLDRQEIHEPRPLLPRPDPGGQHGPHEGGREVRVPPGLQVLDLRHLVDPPGDHALDRGPGAHDPHPGPHDRDAQQGDAGPEAAAPGIRPRADARRGGRRDEPAGRPRPADHEDGAAADLAPVARSATATTPRSATSSRTSPRRTRTT
jgi:hypothetical protein